MNDGFAKACVETLVPPPRKNRVETPAHFDMQLCRTLIGNEFYSFIDNKPVSLVVILQSICVIHHLMGAKNLLEEFEKLFSFFEKGMYVLLNSLISSRLSQMASSVSDGLISLRCYHLSHMVIISLR